MENDLFLRVDREAAAKQFYLVSNVIDTTSSPDITKLEFVGLARQAWLHMRENWNSWVKDYGRDAKGSPTVMTLLFDHSGKKLYFTSSTKKKPGSSWLNLCSPDDRELQLVVKALDECGMEDCANTKHPNKANCGEMLAIHQWAITNPGKGLSRLRDFWMVTVSRQAGTVYIKAPCNVGGQGCERIAKHAELDVIAEPATLPNEQVARSLALVRAPQVSITETATCFKCGNTGSQPLRAYPGGVDWQPCISCFRGEELAKGNVSRRARERYNTDLGHGVTDVMG